MNQLWSRQCLHQPAQYRAPWTQHNRRTGQDPVLRADRFHRADEQEKASQACMGIRVNIWNRAKVSRLITRSLTGGGQHQRGYDALDLDFIKQGDAGGGLGSYAVLCNLPDKVAKYLLEFHPNDYKGLGLPAIPDGASSGDIHKMLDPDQVLLCCLFHYISSSLCSLFIKLNGLIYLIYSNLFLNGLIYSNILSFR